MDQPQRANAAQMAARNIKMAKGKHLRRPGLAQKESTSTQSLSTPSSETGLFGGSIQASGTFNFASPSTLKFDSTTFGTMPSFRTDGAENNVGGFNQSSGNATTLFGAGAAPPNQPTSQTSQISQKLNGFSSGQMMPGFGSGEVQKTQETPSFNFQGSFKEGSFGGSTSAAVPAASSGSSGLMTNSAPNITANSNSTSIFSFGSKSQQTSNSNSIFGSTGIGSLGGIKFEPSNPVPSQSTSTPIFNFKTSALQNQPSTATKTLGDGFTPSQNVNESISGQETKSDTLGSTHTLFGGLANKSKSDESSFSSISAMPESSKNLFGAPQGTTLMQGPNLNQNLFGSGLASNTCVLAPKSSETWGERSPAPTNALSSIFSISSKDGKQQKDSMSGSGFFSGGNQQNCEAKSSFFMPSAQPLSTTTSAPTTTTLSTSTSTFTTTSTSAPTSSSTPTANLFGQQTTTSNMFSSMKKDSSTVPKKSSPLKTFCEVNRPDAAEPKINPAKSIEAQNIFQFGSNPTGNPFLPSVQPNSSTPIKSNLFGSMSTTPNNQSGLSQLTSVAKSQLPAQSGASQVTSQEIPEAQDSVKQSTITNEKVKEINGFGAFKTPADQSGLGASVNEKHPISFAQSLSANPASNAEMKLSQNIFGQANLSVSGASSSIEFEIEAKKSKDQPSEKSKSSSFPSTSEASCSPSQADFSPRKPIQDSSEVCPTNGNEKSMTTIETDPSKILTRAVNSQHIRKTNKFAPKVLPRNPIFRSLALTSQIKDEDILASLPIGIGDIERQQFCTLYRLRALNNAMGKMFTELPVTSDPQIILNFYIEERRIILEECTSIGRKTKRKCSFEESNDLINNKKRKQFEANNYDPTSEKIEVDASHFPRKRKLDEEDRESQNQDKKNKTSFNDITQGLLNFNDSLLKSEGENNELFKSKKITPSSDETPSSILLSQNSEIQKPSGLMQPPIFSSLNSKLNPDHGVFKKKQDISFSTEEKFQSKLNEPLAAKESNTSNKFRSILDGPSSPNLTNHST